MPLQTGWRGLFCFLLFWSSVACAEESPLTFYTNSVDVLIRVREPDQTLSQLAELIDKIQPGAGGLVTSNTEPLGRLISNPNLTGVDQSRDWYVGIYAQEGEPPTIVFAIPAVETKDLVAALPEGTASVVKGNWVVYTDAETVIQPEGDAHAVGLVTGKSLEYFKQGNVSLFVNVEHLATVYASQLELMEDRALEQLNALRFQEAPSGINLQAIMEMYSKMAEVFFQGIRDAQFYSLNLTADAQGLSVDDVLTVKRDSGASQILASNQPAALSLINKLPNDGVAYYGVAGAMKPVVKWALTFSADTLPEGASRDSMKSWISKMDGLEFGPMVAACQLEESDSGLLKFFTVGESSTVDGVKKFSREIAESMGTLSYPGFTQESRLQIDAEKFGTHQADILTVTQKFEENADPFGMQEKMRTLMFGSEGMQTRTVYLSDKYCQTMGGGSAAMTDLLASLDSTRSNGLGNLREEMFPEANLLLFLDIPVAISVSLKEISKTGDARIPFNEQMVDNLNLRRSYLGYAVTTDATTVKTRLRVPVEQIQGFAKLGLMFASLQRQF
ncbi:hypothetical protein [Planctomicrobium sp. SH664]|uniref:hypothetical protein n=1 Tax=Planctomicrobium sp. SH664 TaxID=3448125 RepID=UPI003F5C6684